MHDMTKYYSHTIKALLLLSLTACFNFSPREIKIPDYSLGPFSSDEFPALLNIAIPASEGKVHVFGRVDWSFPGVIDHYFYGIVAITNSDILLLKWYEPEERYKIVERLLYSEILSVSTSSRKPGGSIKLRINNKVLSLGDQNYGSHLPTYLSFRDPEKNEAAFALLRDKIKPQNGASLTPDQSIENDY